MTITVYSVFGSAGEYKQHVQYNTVQNIGIINIIVLIGPISFTNFEQRLKK